MSVSVCECVLSLPKWEYEPSRIDNVAGKTAAAAAAHLIVHYLHTCFRFGPRIGFQKYIKDTHTNTHTFQTELNSIARTCALPIPDESKRTLAASSDLWYMNPEKIT